MARAIESTPPLSASPSGGKDKSVASTTWLYLHTDLLDFAIWWRPPDLRDCMEVLLD